MRSFFVRLVRSRVFWLVLGSASGFVAREMGASAEQARVIQQAVTESGAAVTQ